MDEVTSAAVGILCDIAALYALKNKGEIDFLGIMQEIYDASVAMGDDWEKARNKCMPLIADVFCAYAEDRVIDLREVVNHHLDILEAGNA